MTTSSTASFGTPPPEVKRPWTDPVPDGELPARSQPSRRLLEQRQRAVDHLERIVARHEDPGPFGDEVGDRGRVEALHQLVPPRLERLQGAGDLQVGVVRGWDHQARVRVGVMRIVRG